MTRRKLGELLPLVARQLQPNGSQTLTGSHRLGGATAASAFETLEQAVAAAAAYDCSKESLL